MKNFFKNNNTGAEQINANTEAIELLSEALDTEIANRQAGDSSLENQINLIVSGENLPEELKNIMNRFHITEGTNNRVQIFTTKFYGGTGLDMSSSTTNNNQNFAYIHSILPFMNKAEYDRVALAIGFDSGLNPTANVTLQNTTESGKIKTIDLLNMQPKLTAGEGISISDSNVISASGSSGKTEYSTQGTTMTALIEEMKNVNVDNFISLNMSFGSALNELVIDFNNMIGRSYINVMDDGTMQSLNISGKSVSGNNAMVFNYISFNYMYNSDNNTINGMYEEQNYDITDGTINKDTKSQNFDNASQFSTFNWYLTYYK